MRKNRNSPMWEYLEAAGVLEKGTDEEIKAAKRLYRKKYLLRYKQQQRGSKPEYTVNFSKDSGEYERIILAAKRHKMPVTTFLRSAALAYLNRTYIVPDPIRIARLEQLLSDCLNEIKTIAKTKERFFWGREQKVEEIEKRIVKLESDISEVLRNPPLAFPHDHQNQIA